MTLPMKASIKMKISSFMAVFMISLGSMSLALAEDPTLPAGSSAPGSGATSGMGGVGQQPGGLMAFAPFILMFAVLYFLVLRPQQKKMKDQQSMLSSLKHGDEVVTASGILGKVTGITDKVVTVEVADNVRVKMLKSQVTQVVKGNLKDIVQ